MTFIYERSVQTVDQTGLTTFHPNLSQPPHSKHQPPTPEHTYTCSHPKQPMFTPPIVNAFVNAVGRRRTFSW